MSTHKRRSHRKPSWNTNEICLAVVGGIMAALMLFAIVAAGTSPGGLPAAMAAAICPGIITAIPLLLLWRSRRKYRGRRSMGALVRSSSISPGYADVTVSGGQALPKICIRCGSPTRRVSPFRFQGNHTDSSPYDWSRVSPLAMVIIAWKFGTYLIFTKLWESIEKRINRHKAASDRVVFKIPHCKSCVTGNPVVQRHFDFHGRIMILEAHPAFREQLRQKRDR